MYSIDEIDKIIIKLLQINPRISYSEIAKEIGFSRNAIKYRIKSLQDEGYLLGFRTVLDPHKFGKKITAVISLKTGISEINHVKKKLLEMPELLMVFQVSGTKFMSFSSNTPRSWFMNLMCHKPSSERPGRPATTRTPTNQRSSISTRLSIITAL